MKHQDIVVGTDYTFSQSEHGLKRRAKVLAGPIKKMIEKRGYGKRQATVFTVEINYGEGNVQTFDTEARYLREPWAEYAERERQLRLIRRRSEDAAKVAREERAKVILALIPLLEAEDEALETYDVTDLNVFHEAAELGLHLFMPDVEGYSVPWPTFVAPRARDLWAYYLRGTQVPVKTTEYLRLLRGANALARM